MRAINRTTPWVRRTRLAALAVFALSLVACATGYSYVKPAGDGSGGYYTSSGPYTGEGYYDTFGTGPYYAGTSGWGYYNGSAPYIGWDVGFGGWSYWPGMGFGVSGVWNFPGYWGPWYGGYPRIWWGCRHRHCRHYRSNARSAGHAEYLGVTSLRPTLPASSGAPAPQAVRSVVLPQDFGPRDAGAWQRDPDAIRHARFVHAPAMFERPARPYGDGTRTAPENLARPVAIPPPVRQSVDFPQARGNAYGATPRAAPRPSFQPRMAGPGVRPAPQPRGGREGDIRHH